MTHFILVHGAFHGAWCWVKLQAELERRGHSAQALDMPGCGDDLTPLETVTLDSYADRIVDALRAVDGAPPVLVGHSLGTMSVSLAAERAPEKIGTLVLLGGCTARNGMSMYTLLQLLDAPDEPILAMPPPGHPWNEVSQDPPLAQVPELYYNDCSPEDTAYAMARLRPQTNAPRITPLTITPERFGSVPRVFISGEFDNAHTLARRRGTLALDPCERVFSLPTGHSPFFSAPGALADILCQL